MAAASVSHFQFPLRPGQILGMKGFISLYLDLFRFLAAMGVFLYHAGAHPISSGILPDIYFNHELVIIFFVISGYVIAASAARPDRTLVNYGADRVARLSSVVIPALALTYFLDYVGARFSPDVYQAINPQWQSIRFLANFFYCQQIWFLCVNPSSNNPFWSLGYEFWYYVLFAVLIFVRSNRTKIVLLLAIALFVGPKILLLLPAWAVGAGAFHVGKSWHCSRLKSWLLFISTGLTTLLVLVFGHKLGLNDGQAGQPPLYYSSSFLGDNLFAVVVAAHFLACYILSRHFTKHLDASRVAKLIRWMASHTFSLYLYHVPILWFILAVTKYDARNPVAVLTALAVTLLAIVGLSKVTEERYPALRSLLRRWIGRVVERFRVNEGVR